MLAGLYRAVTTAGGPLIRSFLARRMRRGKEDPARFGERLGQPSRPRPPGPLVWLHCASVGESLSMLPLVERIVARPGMSLLMTTGTVTSARLMEQRLPKGAFHQYVPVDRVAWVRPFLDHWRPDLALWAESELWPNLLAETRRRGVPQILVNARMSPRSFRGWSRVPGLARHLLSHFALTLAQTPEDGDRLCALGAGEVRCLGNLKLAAPPLPCDDADLAELGAAIGARPLWLAASTHSPEEALIGRVHQALAAAHPSLLTVIVPRHPHRGPEVAGELKAMGLSVSLRSAGGLPGAGVYVADTMGELGLFYRLAPIVFVGKSLAAEGGQNPVEPARLGAAVLFGPLMTNFPGIVPSMLVAGAARQVEDEAGLAGAVADLLSDPAALAEARARALAWAEGEANALGAFRAALEPFLAGAEARHARA
ncbi:MAG: 3-deoxy-D-manno-octulosonic acid transferase [Pseudomonadota bacterium]